MEEKQWFLYVADHHEGPFSAAEIQKLVKKGEARTSSYVWKEGMADWIMMSDVPDFAVPAKAEKKEGHGPLSFLIPHKTEVSVPRPAVAALEPAAPAGPDMSGVTPSLSVWCLSSNKTFNGPHSMKTIIRYINDGEASINDLVWREGWTSFVAIKEIPDFMQQIKPEIAQAGGGVRKKKGKGASDALGLQGGVRGRSRAWYRSPKFLGFALIVSLLGIYQAAVTGRLDSALEKTGQLEKVKALGLPPIPMDARHLETAKELAFKARDVAVPLIQKAVVYLPPSVQEILSPVKLPEGLNAADAKNLRAAAASPASTGSKVATAIVFGQEQNPAFLIAGNLADGPVNVILRGKEGTLLNAFSYEKSLSVNMKSKVARTAPFGMDEGRPLPQGEYALIIQGSGRQIYASDNYFLGGKKDGAYAARLQEFNSRIRGRVQKESAELKQIAFTLESMANESANKFFSMAGTPLNTKSKSTWLQYHGKYAKMSAQLKGVLDKANPEVLKKEYALPQLYEKVKQTYELTERLHAAETGYVQKGGGAAASALMTEIRKLAGSAAVALKDLNEAIARVKD